MVPSSFDNFFLAMAGADAALLGLLFVAVSISPERIFGPGAAPERRAIATNAFTSLIVAFFVSTAALLPGSDVAATFVVMALLGLVASTRLGIQLARYHVRLPREKVTQPLWLRLIRALTTVVGTLVVYGFLFSSSLRLSFQPHDLPDVAVVAALVLVCCGLGLFRAWELLGAPRQGVLGWLNPLRPDADEPTQTDTPTVAASGTVTASMSADASLAASPSAPGGAQAQH